MLVLILLLTSVSSEIITINLITAPERNKVSFNYTGTDSKVITDKEIKLFNLTDDNLKKGFRVELGAAPNDVFLKDPTPYHDLFNKYKWNEVTRNVEVKKVEVIDIINENTVLKRIVHINNTTDDIETKLNVFTEVNNVVKLAWANIGLLNDEIPYILNVDYEYGKVNEENKWGIDKLISVSSPFGMSKEEIVDIKSGQTIVTELSAFKIIVLVRAVFKAELVGNVIGNYAKLYGKYHFWAPSIRNIMRAAKLTNEIITQEVIEIRCFTKPKVRVFDNNTGKLVEPRRKKKPLMKILRNKKINKAFYTGVSKLLA